MTTEINLLTFFLPLIRTHVGAPVQPHPGVGTQPKTGVYICNLLKMVDYNNILSHSWKVKFIDFSFH